MDILNGQLIRQLRERLRLNQTQLGALCGLKQGSVSDIERGHRQTSLSNGVRIAEALGVRPEELLMPDGQGAADP